MNRHTQQPRGPKVVQKQMLRSVLRYATLIMRYNTSGQRLFLTNKGTIHTTLPLPSTVKHIDGVQVLRAAAVILVVWFHVNLQMSIRFNQSLPTLGVFGIDIFFVISGFILSTVALKIKIQSRVVAAKDFMLRRLVRIYPLYWALYIAIACRRILAHQFWGHGFLWSFTLLPAFYSSPAQYNVDFSWTLVFEMWFYFLMAVCILVNRKYAVRICIGMLAASTILGSVIPIYHPLFQTIINPILAEFMFGCVAALLYTRLGAHRSVGSVVCCAGCVAAFALNSLPLKAASFQNEILSRHRVLERSLTWGITAFLIVGGMVLWSPKLHSSVARLFVQLGNASYSIYLCSPLAIEYIGRFVIRLKHVGTRVAIVEQVAITTATTILVVIVGWCCYNWVEWPMIRKIQRWVGIGKQPKASHSLAHNTVSRASV